MKLSTFLMVGVIILPVLTACGATPAPMLPEPWHAVDLGETNGSGITTFDPATGQWTLASGAGDFNGSHDRGRYVYRELEGNFDLVVRLVDQTPMQAGDASTGRAGLMLREGPGDAARGLWLWREGRGWSSTQRAVPDTQALTRITPRDKSFSWLRLVRWRDTLIIYVSADGKDWGRSVRSLNLDNLSAKVQVGMVVCSRFTGKQKDDRARATFADLAIRPYVPTHITSWLGNTYNGVGMKMQVPMHVNGFALHEATGVSAMLAVWDEQGPNLVLFDAEGKLMLDPRQDRIFEGASGWAVALDDKYVYATAWQNKTTRGFQRYNYAGKDQPFPGMEKSFIEVPSSRIPRGLAVDTARQELHVALEPERTILIYDLNKPQAGPKRSWKLEQEPRQIALDRAGNLWVVRRFDDTHLDVARYSPTGELQKTISGLELPMGLSVRDHGDLLVCDSGRLAQNVKIYAAADLAGPAAVLAKPSATFGRPGGIYSGVAGAMAPHKLVAPIGAGVDRQGHVYVAGNLIHWRADFADGKALLTNRVPGNGMASGTQLQRYGSLAPDAPLDWERFGLEGMAAADFAVESDGTDIYSREHRYKIDYTQPPGKDWTYVALTHDPYTYPHDLRLVDNTGYLPGGTRLRTLQGQRFLYVRDQRYYALMVYRFAPGSEIAIPTAALVTWTSADNHWPPHRPAEIGDGNFLWVDRNGDGQMDADEYARLPVKLTYTRFQIDADGSIWGCSNRMTNFFRWRCAGVDARGVPKYDAKAMDAYDVPAEFNSVGHVWYEPARKQLFVIGYPKNTPHVKENTATTIGTDMACYDNFPAAPRLAWRTTVPFATHRQGHGQVATEIVGVLPDYVVTQQLDIGEFHFWRRADGALRQTFLPGPEIGWRVGLADMPWSAAVMQRKNGEIVITREENEDGKIVLMRIQLPPIPAGPAR